MGRFKERFRSFINNRWLVFVAAMWMQSCAGIGYLFGSISPVIKSSLNYNQRQIARLGVAKDLGDSIGFLAGTLCEVLPIWAALLIGALQNLVGYGWVWLIVTGRVSVLPLWAVSRFWSFPDGFTDSGEISWIGFCSPVILICSNMIWMLLMSLGPLLLCCLLWKVVFLQMRFDAF